MIPPHGSVDAWFAEAIELGAKARAELLGRIAASDPALAEDVRALLEAHDQAAATDFLAPLDEEPAADLLAFASAAGPIPAIELGRFRILRRLGGGAMGLVYLAEDPRLKRRVAIKVLPPWIAADDDGRRRFLREARSASRLDHPNVATIHEVGETPDGRPWIVMAHCEGPTLAERLRAGPIPVDEAERLFREVAAGLAAAHRLGIVHRDVKPSNIVLSPTGARILDFGIAQLEGVTTTRVGVLGTVPYMSPEQTRGEVTDVRTDVWSLGVVGYEMLAGRRPFAAENDAALIHSIRHDDPVSLRELRDDAPEHLVGWIEACLARDPVSRPGSAARVGTSMEPAAAAVSAATTTPAAASGRTRWGVLAAALLVLAALVGIVSTVDRSAASGDPEDRSIAVLPFEATGGEEADLWARGLQDDLLTGLAGVPALRVTSRRAAEDYRGSDDASQAAQGLGVRWVVEGAVRTLGDELRLNLRIVDPTTQRQAWADSYRRPLTSDGLVGIGEEALSDVGSWLEVETAASEGAPPPPDLEVWRRYVEGRTHLDGRTESGLGRAEGEFRAAVAAAPNFAEGWAGLADALLLQGVLGFTDPAASFAEARQAAGRAIEIQPDLPEAHATMGMVVATADRDGPGALWWFRRAVAMQPSNVKAQQWLGAHLVSIGRLEEAGPPLRRAVQLEPNSAPARSSLARWYQFSDSAEAALREIRIAQRLEPGTPAARLLEGELLRSLGRTEEAREVLLDAIALPGVNRIGFPGMWVELAATHMELGDTARAEALLDEVRRDMPPFVLASVESFMGNRETALDLLESAPVLPVFTTILRYHPVFDPIRGGPRMEAILRRYDDVWRIAPP